MRRAVGSVRGDSAGCCAEVSQLKRSGSLEFAGHRCLSGQPVQALSHLPIRAFDELDDG